MNDFDSEQPPFQPRTERSVPGQGRTPGPTRSVTWRLNKRRQALLILAAVTSVGAIGLATPSISSAALTNPPSVTSELEVSQDRDLEQGTDGTTDDGGDSDWSEDDSDSFDDDWTGDDWTGDDWTDPFDGMTDEDIDALTDQEFYDILDNASYGDELDSDDSDWNDTDWDDSNPEGTWDDSDWSSDDDGDWTDPFHGMTDEQIDALTDQEFYDILDNASYGDELDSDDSDWNDTDFDDSDLDDTDWNDSDLDDTDWNDSDWTDPFEGMTDEEIDALTDEEFYDILDNAGYGEELDWDDGDWDDTDWDDTDFDDWSGDDADWGDDWDEGEWDDYDDGDWDGEWGDETPVATFEVVDGNLVGSGASAEQLAQAEAIWERFSQLIPASERTMLNGFELMGPDYGGAHVYADEQDPTKWIMGVDTALSGSDLDYVLVHEFGHLLTLKASEVPPSFDNDACPTFHPGEGCALSQSTLAKFVAAFWPQSLQDQLAEINDSGDWSALDAYYAENADSFVSDYALTNPVEDLAETFTEFVLKDRPVGNTVADQKVSLLWEDRDMVALRTEIRSRMQ